MNHTLKSITLAAAATLAVTAHAGEKEMLDLLVKKGTITAEERGKLLEESKAKSAASGVDRVFPKEDVTKRLTISGYFQTQYQGFDYSQDVAGVSTSNYVSQGGFLMRRLYLEVLADVGEGLSGNIVLDTSGNTSSSLSSWLDRAMVSHASTIGTFDFGYRKVTWGYEESTTSSLFKASSSKLATVERGITNRYWNEAENGGGAGRSDGRRLGFGAHHTGLHYTSVANPQGLEYGASVVNAAQGRFSEGKGLNDLALYANAVYNYKVSDNEKYAIGVNWGRSQYFTSNNTVNTAADISGYNPFVHLQYFDLGFSAEYMTTKVTSSKDAAVNTDDQDHSPKGYNAMVTYKINDTWEGVARYTYLDTDLRGQKISDGERGFTAVGGNSDSLYNKSDAVYLGLNYYFTLNARGATVNGYNAKIQLGYEMANFKGVITAASTPTVDNTKEATVNTVRLQAQIAF